MGALICLCRSHAYRLTAASAQPRSSSTEHDQVTAPVSSVLGANRMKKPGASEQIRVLSNSFSRSSTSKLSSPKRCRQPKHIAASSNATALQTGHTFIVPPFRHPRETMDNHSGPGSPSWASCASTLVRALSALARLSAPSAPRGKTRTRKHYSSFPSWQFESISIPASWRLGSCLLARPCRHARTNASQRRAFQA